MSSVTFSDFALRFFLLLQEFWEKRVKKLPCKLLHWLDLVFFFSLLLSALVAEASLAASQSTRWHWTEASDGKKREDEEAGGGEAPWRPFSCLLSMAEVTWATLIPLPNTRERKKEEEQRKEDDGKEGRRVEQKVGKWTKKTPSSK